MGDILGIGSMSAAISNGTIAKRNAWLNYKAQMYTNQSNERLAREQNDFNLKMWNLNNQYNDPSQQFQRLRNAGLSDAAAAQSVANVGSLPVQSADLANQVAPHMDNWSFDPSAIPSAQNFLNLGREYLALKRDAVDTRVKEKTEEPNIRNIFTQADALQFANDIALENLDFLQKSHPHSLRSLAALADRDELLAPLTRLGMRESRMKLRLARQQFGFLKDWNNKKLKELDETINGIIASNQLTGEKVKTEKVQQGVLGQQKKVLEAQEENVKAGTEQTKAQTEQTKEQTKGEKLKNYGQVLDNSLKSAGMPEDRAARVAALVADGIIPIEKIPRMFRLARTFIRSGGRIFNGDSTERDYFNYFINAATGQSGKNPVWSKGSLDYLMENLSDQAIIKHLKKYLDFDWLNDLDDSE